MSNFLQFRKRENDVLVLNKKTKVRLGIIRYNKAWEIPVFEPEPNTIFSAGCLMQINHVLRLNKES